MITGLAVSVLLLHHHRRVAGRRAVNYDYAGALPRRCRGGWQAAPYVAGTCQHRQMVWVRRARRRGVREEPVHEAP